MFETFGYGTFGYGTFVDEAFGYGAAVSKFTVFGALGGRGVGKTLTSRKLEVLRSLP
ncbi:hypothetical protein [Streptomyces rishiriensis]|uniref:hypothetical protein n=1 Tax=Streptomyces rishiriensis TaxID=68264 RepID=UPI0033C04704